MDSKLSIQQASQVLGVSAKTLRRWEASGVLIPTRSAGGQRRYVLDEIKNFKKPKKTLDTPFVSPEIPYVQGVLASPILPSQKTIITWAIGTLLIAGMAVGGIKLYSFTKLFKAGPGPLAKQAEIGAGAVLAAESVNPEYNLKVSVPAIFTKNITAPNVIYSVKAGSGIQISGTQDLTISSTANSDPGSAQNIFKTFKIGTTEISAASNTDTFTFASGDNVSLSADTTNKKLTISASVSNSSGWTDDGSNVRLSTSSDTVTIGSSLIISDAGLIDLSAVVHDDSAPQGLKLPQNTTLTNISSGEGFLAYDSDDNLVKVFDGSAWATVGGTATGDITAVIAGAGLTGGATSGDATLDIGGSTTITIGADAISVTADSIGDTQLAFNTGQDLSTSSTPTFAGLTLNGNLDMTSDLILNIGNSGTDFNSSGGLVLADDLAINGGDLTTSQSTFNLINATATTLNLGGAATTFNIAPTGSGASSLVLSGGSADTGCTINGATGDLSCSGNIAGASTGTNGYWQRNAGALAPTNITDDLIIGGTATASGVFQVFGLTGDVQMDGDLTVSGGDIIGASTTNIANAATTLNLGSTNVTRSINIGTGANADTINIGTGGTTADTITIGNSASTTALNLTSGTGSQTFASSVASGTTSTSAFVFTANSLTTGTGQYLNSSSLSTGTLFSDYSTSTALSTGKLGYFNWEPSAAATASGDLVGINIGNGGFTTGNLFNISNIGTSLFAVNQTQIVSSVPQAFNATGDVAMAYDLQFTNQTASFLKSNATLYIQSGESFENNNLNLQTFGTGGIVLAAANGTTTTSGTSYALQVTPTLTSVTNSLAHTLYGTYNFPVVNTTGTGVGVTTLYGNFTGLNKVAGTITTWFGNYIAAPTGSGTVTNPYALVTEASAGNVGIGLTAPIAKLHVTDNSTATASAFIANTSTSAGIAGLAIKLSSTTLDTTSRFINFLDKNGSIIGKINAANTTSVAYSTEGTDMAEYFTKNDGSTFEPGDVVSASENYAIKTILPYDSKMLGIVSTAPGFTGGHEGANKVLVALVGQVPVKIDPASESIARGDFITSSTNGLAKKANRAGFMVGKALDNWTPGSGDKISIYVSNIWADPTNQIVFDEAGNLTIPGTLTADDAQINSLTESVNDRLTVINTQFSTLDNEIASLSAQLADLQMQSDPAASLSAQLWTYATDSGKLVTTLPVQTSDLAVIGKLTVGLLTFDDLEASISSLTGTVTVNGDLAVGGKLQVLGSSIGQATLPLGLTELVVESTAVSTNSAIFVTPNLAVPIPLSVTDSTPGASFKVQITSPQAKDIPFKWWIVN